MPADGLRDAVKLYSPPWLATGTAELYLYVPGLLLDAYVDGLQDAVKGRMPGVGDPSGLQFIGADRLLERGPSESDEAYATRLSGAFMTWRTAGSPATLLRQITIALGVVLRIRVVSNSGVWFTIAEGATADEGGDYPVTRYRASPNNWDWDGLTTRWWRAWPIVYAGTHWEPEGTWGDGLSTWGEDGAWGMTATLEEVATMRRLARTWKPAHVAIPWIIVSFDDALFDPTDPTPGPDGTWGRWSKDDGTGNYVAARSSDARYIDGVI